MTFDKTKYDIEYVKKYVTRKVIPFNRLNDDDVELLKWIESRDENITQYIKRLIKEDMNRQSPE